MEIKDVKTYYKTPIPHLNIILGGAGVPLPSIIEMFGSEGGAKTTIALFFASQFLKNFKNSRFLYIDTEFKLDEKRFDYIMFNNNISKDRYEIFRSNYIEDIFDKLEEEYRKAGIEEVKLIAVLDSIANTISKPKKKRKKNGEEVEESKGYSGAKDASLITSRLTSLSADVFKANSQLIIINQVRDNLSTGRGFRTPKGRHLKHIVPIRIKVSKDGKVAKKIGDVEVEEGITVKLEIEKNQLFIPRFMTKLFVHNEKGVDVIYNIHEQLKEFKIVSQAGAWTSFKYGDYNLKWRGLSEFKKVITENPDLLDLFTYLMYQRFMNISPLAKVKMIDDVWELEERFGFEKTELTEKEKELYEYLNK